MKCGALLLYKTTGKVRLKKKLVRLISRRNQAENPQWIDRPLSEYEVCDGDIGVDIALDPGYNYGDDYDCRCSIETSYFCKKCGNQDFPELPYGQCGVVQLAEERIAEL